jgi:predicted transcriptional regulator
VDGTLGERELDVMSVLWRDGPGTVAEVRDRLPVDLAYNTVLTILRNLESKAFVGHTTEGRFFRYFPAVSEQAVRGNALSRLVDKLFGGSRTGLIAHLVEQESLTSDEVRELHELLDARLSSADSAKDPPRPASRSTKAPTSRRKRT